MNHPPKTITLRVVLRMLIFVVVLPFLPLLISRHWDWWEAWAYGIMSVLGFAISRVLAARRHPDIIAERARFGQQEDTPAWDRRILAYLTPAWGAVMLVAGLDALFGWTPPFGLPVTITSLVVILAGYALSSYALIENRYFSAMVRIQSERDHHVVSSGPYRWMRHPGYAGGLLTYLGTPLLLNSVWVSLPIVLIVILTVIRTHLEDRFLQGELDGYREYAERVRYRLLPGIW